MFAFSGAGQKAQDIFTLAVPRARSRALGPICAHSGILAFNRFPRPY